MLFILSGFLSLASWGQIPRLSSDPAAQAVVFLDFDGQYVQGSAWNWTGPIAAQASGLSSAAVTAIYNRVAEDFRIFTLNITTDSAAYQSAPANRRIRVIITPTYEWYGMAGGVSYVGSFTWGDDTPAWVFSGLLSNSTKKIAEAVSHEAGHTLGLQHQSTYDGSCNKTAEYNPGTGTGEIAWAPIMGISYSKNSTTWYNGPNSFGCGVLQDDIAIIASPFNQVQLRSDDHADLYESATFLPVSGGSFQRTGLITSASDKDVFRFDLFTPNLLNLSVTPQNVGSANSGANLDIRISLLNSSGDTVGSYNPADLLNASIDSNLLEGSYYLVVEGVANSFGPDYGSLGYYTINGTLASTLPVEALVLKGQNNGQTHFLQWTLRSTTPIELQEIEGSLDGIHYSRIISLPVSSRTSSLPLPQAGSIQYRIKVRDEAGRVYYSNTVLLEGIGSTDKIRFINRGASLEVNTAAASRYVLYNSTGQFVKSGTLQGGTNRIGIESLASGVYIIQVASAPGVPLPIHYKFVKP